MALRSARTPPATSSGRSPRLLNAIRNADILIGEAVPSMKRSNAASASSAVRECP